MPPDEAATRLIGEANPLHERIANDFTYHAPSSLDVIAHTTIRERAQDLAHLIVDLTPPEREQSLALTNLEQAVFWANAAIARHE